MHVHAEPHLEFAQARGQESSELVVVKVETLQERMYLRGLKNEQSCVAKAMKSFCAR